MKTKLTKEDIDKIVFLYQNETPSTHKLAEQFKVGHKKISKLLVDNGIRTHNKGGQIKLGNSVEVGKSKVKRLIASNGRKLVAICKKTGIRINDPMNLSGSLTNHLIELYGNGLEIPNNTYQRKRYELEHGKKWFEEYFDVIEEDLKSFRKCRYCEWSTEDVTNTTGCYENHLKNSHNKTLKEFLFEFPAEIKYHSVYEKSNNYKLALLDEDNFVVCKLCNTKMRVISNTHLKLKHNITQSQYKLKYPLDKLVSNSSNKIFTANYHLGNVNMKPTWTSKGEIEVKEFIESLGLVVEKSRNRKLLDGKEIDLIIPSMKIGIEYNGLYYHTEKMGKHSTYHLNKTMSCNTIGYGLIHIFEDEWVTNKELIKNKLKHIFKVNNGIRIGARECSIKLIEQSIKSDFLKENHIQGNDNSNLSYGAYYGDALVGVITFTNKRNMSKGKTINEKEYELTRFATKQGYIVSGLASKMLKTFIVDYKPENVISFADRRWTLDGNNNLYTNLGFKLTKIRKPDYKYYNSKIDKHRRFHKFGFGLSSLKKKFPNLEFNKSDGKPKTEKELTTELGYDKIWDCGLFKYELNLK